MLMFSIGFYIFFVIFFFVSVFASIFNYKKRFNLTYHVRNTFPYELNYESRFSDNILGNAALIMSLCFLIGFYVILNVHLNNPIVLIASIVGCINSILIGTMFFVPLKLLKTHMAFSIFLFLTAFLLPGITAVIYFPYYQDFLEPLYLVFFIVSSVVALFYFGVTMNPKLTLNIKMDVKLDDKGQETYVRPKYITYAFSEWLSIFGAIIHPLLLIILLVLQS